MNLLCHFTLIQEFLPGMLEARKGHIVTMASVASFVNFPSIIPYAATKAAVDALDGG